jgi:hypothetical protein
MHSVECITFNFPTTAPVSVSISISNSIEASGRSSASKRLQPAGLEIDYNGFKRHALALKNPELPNTLREMLLDVQGCAGSGLGIMPDRRHQEIPNRVSQDCEFCVVSPHMFTPAANRDNLGSMP